MAKKQQFPKQVFIGVLTAGGKPVKPDQFVVYTTPAEVFEDSDPGEVVGVYALVGLKRCVRELV